MFADRRMHVLFVPGYETVQMFFDGAAVVVGDVTVVTSEVCDCVLAFVGDGVVVVVVVVVLVFFPSQSGS